MKKQFAMVLLAIVFMGASVWAYGTTVTVNDNTVGTGTNQFNYQGSGWLYGACSACYAGDNHWDLTTNDYFTFQFNGQQAVVYGSMDFNGGIAAYSVDGGAETNFDDYAATRVDNVFLFATPILTTGTHTLKVRVTGTKNSASTNIVLPSDRIDVISSSLPSGWTDLDIGSPGLAGSATYSGTTYTVNGGGADIWGTSDQFNYAETAANGDVTITARVVSQQNTNGWAKAGVMIRDTTGANAAHVYVYMTPGNGAVLQYRSSTGASASIPTYTTGLVAPYWVRLVRSGSTFTGSISPDGTTWTTLGSVTATIGTNALGGLAVTAHDNTQLNTSTFDNVAVSSGVTTVTVNDNTVGTGVNQFNYQGGGWLYGACSACYAGDNHWDYTTNDYYTFQFNGQQASVYGSMDFNGGIAAYSVDGGAETNFDDYAATRVDNVFLFATPILSNGLHTLKVRVTGTKNPSSTYYVLPADRIDVSTPGGGGGTVATPTFSPAAGTYDTAQTVTISDSTSGATIHYTTDGSTPTASSATYSSPITVSTSETVKAIGVETGWTDSAVGSAAYTLMVATPTFSPGAGTYSSAQTVTISDLSAGATIHYTTDGSTPTASSTTYSAPITVSTSETVKAIGVLSGWTTSVVGSAAYTISSGSGHTWYVRPDGGTRYSSNITNGQCNGMYDASYASTGGTGVNQNCAFNDFRYLYDDQSGSTMAWVISGGDTVVVRGCTAQPGQQNPANPDCRIGWDGPTGPTSGNWCYGVGSYTCVNPPIPAGTATQHTRILGQCVLAGTCNTGNTTNRANLTQLFAGFSLAYTINLGSTQYVDIEGIELTTHNGKCVVAGSPAYPRGCSTSQPVDDYGQNGFLTNNTTSNITFQDVYVHGFNSSGLFGPIGGPITMTRMFIGFNAFAGWNFDDGYDTPDAAGSSIAASYVTMEGNGCYEQYPIVNTAFPAQVCYDSDHQGFGDSWSGQDTDLDSFTCDHCVTLYNTKDGFIGPHTLIHALTITDSVSIGNMGAQWKWTSATNGTALFQNNLTVGNCWRMSQPLPGAPSTYNQYLDLFCRAGGSAFANSINSGAVNNFYGNTVVGAANIIFQYGCGYLLSNCQTSQINLKDNNFLGYTDPNVGDPSALYCALTVDGNDCDLVSPSGVQFTASYNSEFGLKSGTTDTCGSNGIICSDPLLVDEPAQSWPGSEGALDNFNFTPSSSSPLIGAGVSVPGLTTDYNGTTRPNPPSIGAIE